MPESLLYKIWKNLELAEKEAVFQAARSPLFNQRESVTKLITFLIDTAKDKNAPSKAALSQVVFGKKMPDVKLRHQMNYALELIRKTMAFLQNQKQEGREILAYIQQISTAAPSEIIARELNRADRIITSNPAKSSAYYLDKYHLALEQWEVQREKKRGVGNLVQVNQSFEQYVAYQALRQGCAALAQAAVAGAPNETPFLEETLRFAEAGSFENEPAILMFYYGYQALTDKENTAAFQQLKAHLFDFQHLFPLHELRDIYVLAINFCIKKLNTGEKEFVREAFELYNTGLELGILIENGQLSRFTYRNILNIALGLEEWDWALDYLEKYKSYLPAPERKNTYQYNLATYYFRRPDYDAALDLLRHVEFRDTLYNYDARRMLLRIYHAQGAWDALDSLLDSFSIYLRRQKTQGYHFEMYSNLVRYTKRLLRLKPSDKKGRGKFVADVEAERHLAERGWLLGLVS